MIICKELNAPKKTSALKLDKANNPTRRCEGTTRGPRKCKVGLELFHLYPGILPAFPGPAIVLPTAPDPLFHWFFRGVSISGRASFASWLIDLVELEGLAD